MKTLDKLEIPLIQGGMGVGISMGNLAGHVAKEGGMGVISTASIGFREPDFWENPLEAGRRALAAEISKAKEISDGKGMVAINAMVATTHYEEMVKAACDAGIDAIICGAGLPLSLPELVGDRDVLIAPVVSSGKAARTIMRYWDKNFHRKPDFIVVEGSRAGGHLGFSYEEAMGDSGDSLEKIVADVVAVSQLPVFAAGSVFSSEEAAKVKEAGAVGVQMATPFIATAECDASQGFKDVIISGSESEVTIIKSPVGMPGRALNTPLVQRTNEGERIPPKRCISCIKTCKPAETPFCINQALINGFYGNSEEGLFFCGGNVGKVNEMTTVSEICQWFKGIWREI